jgi:hypothetical protein
MNKYTAPKFFLAQYSWFVLEAVTWIDRLTKKIKEEKFTLLFI